MINVWRVGNFKKFSGKRDFELRPLTVLSGINSSGKSSLLQSILLIKQTVTNSSPDRAISLNGPLLQLGSFTDIGNFPEGTPEKSKVVSFGWDMSPVDDDETGAFDERFYTETQPICCKIDFDLSAAKRPSSNISPEMYPTLERACISLFSEDASDDEDDISYTLKIQRSSGRGKKFKFDSSSIGSDNNLNEYIVKDIDEYTKDQVIRELPKARIIGCSLSNFFPGEIIFRYDRGLNSRNRIEKQILSERRSLIRARSLQIPEDVVKLLRSLVLEVSENLEQTTASSHARNLLDKLTGRVPVNVLNLALRKMRPSTRKRIQESFSKNKKKIAASLKEGIPSDLFITRTTPDVVRVVPDIALSFFKFHVHYVGPLRDEPKPIYSSRQVSASTDVGPRGEYTAAVLSLNEKNMIRYIDPSSVKRGYSNYIQKEASLTTALAEWLTYLGIATAIEVSDKGNLGYELKVKASTDDILRDLTNVGVGVSQVLPVLVTVLLAKPGAVVLLEQPELHLHPRVQSLLCDFFLAASKQGKQLIVETHSEHIIERLRLRVAEEPEASILNDAIIYFFGSGEEGVRKIELSEYGAVLDWPQGFFDESSNQTAEILNASIKKKMFNQSR